MRSCLRMFYFVLKFIWNYLQLDWSNKATPSLHMNYCRFSTGFLRKVNVIRRDGVFSGERRLH